MILKNKGFVLPTIVISSTLVFLIASIIAGQILNNYQLATQDVYRLHSQFGADAGIDSAIVELNLDDEWAGTAGEVDIINTPELRLTREVTVNKVADDEVILTSIGRSYSPGDETTPETTRTYEVELEGLESSGTFSIVTGVGGLSLTNSAKIVAGDVYVNGEISMTNSATIGLSLNPVGVHVAHQSCPNPPDASYPRVCGSGENGQPISMTNSSHIYGEVNATNQTDGSRMSSPGLIPNQTVPPAALPTHDRDAQKAAATNVMSSSAASCWGSGTKVWPANTRITGNVNLSNSCSVTVLGDVWIEGTLNMSNSTRMYIDDSVGTDLPVIMVDGQNGFNMSNSTEIVANADNTGAHILTYWSTASCSPDCADVTGSDLYNSRSRTTINMSNSAEASSTLLHARWTQVNISNAGDIGAIVGQTVRLTNTATITFGTSTTGGGSSQKIWDIRSYKRVF